MSVKINYTCECWIVIPYKTNTPHFIAWVITYKNVELIVKICQKSKTVSLFLIARDDIRCDVDEIMWPDREERLDVHEWLQYYVCCMFSSNMYCNIVYSCAQLYPTL